MAGTAGLPEALVSVGLAAKSCIFCFIVGRFVIPCFGVPASTSALVLKPIFGDDVSFLVSSTLSGGPRRRAEGVCEGCADVFLRENSLESKVDPFVILGIS